MADKKQQKPTEKSVNASTGLTPIQEQAALLLASGETITAVATKLEVNRCTLYEWQKLVTFQCYFNQQATDYRDSLRNGLFGLADEALKVIKGCLQSGNEITRLKTAIWLIERVKDVDTGETDVREVIKEKCTHIQTPWDMEKPVSVFNENEYNKELKRLHLEI